MKHIGKIYLVTSALVAILAIAGIAIVVLLLSPHEISAPQPVLVEIKKGDSLNRISNRLKRADVIGSKLVFKWSSIISGNSKRYKTGRYRIDRNKSVVDLIRLLKKGNPIMLSVTIPEGLTMTEIFDLLSRTGYQNNSQYNQIIQDQAYVRSLELPHGITYLEGFLYPDTYKFSNDATEASIIKIMVNTFFKRLPKDYESQAQKLGLSFYEAIVLASIIEKETGISSERRIISSVLHNRLKKKMRLQADPTVIYGIKGFNGNLTRKQLRTPSPYNTYLNKGLPPTPIANPGRESLMAAVNPANTKLLYFVAMGNGKHKFSASYRSHVNAVRRFQKRWHKNYRSF